MAFHVDPRAATAAGDARARPIQRVTATPGLLVEVASASFAGTVVGCDHRQVTLRDRRGRTRRFGLSPGAFLVHDQPVDLVPPETGSPAPEQRVTNSGSLAAVDTPTRTARASRLLVEGVHDAELIEQVWGADLRVEGVVVEVLHGADDLAEVVRNFGPAPGRRIGVLLDHLVDGSKETAIARQAADPDVLVRGHPFVDIWAAVRPEVLGIDAWPQVPMGEPWKQGVARRLGFDDHRELWQRIRSRVTTWRDLDRALLRSVEELIDFVTADEADVTPEG